MQRFEVMEVAVVRSLLLGEVVQDEKSWEVVVEQRLMARSGPSAAKEAR